MFWQRPQYSKVYFVQTHKSTTKPLSSRSLNAKKLVSPLLHWALNLQYYIMSYCIYFKSGCLDLAIATFTISTLGISIYTLKCCTLWTLLFLSSSSSIVTYFTFHGAPSFCWVYSTVGLSFFSGCIVLHIYIYILFWAQIKHLFLLWHDYFA